MARASKAATGAGEDDFFLEHVCELRSGRTPREVRVRFTVPVADGARGDRACRYVIEGLGLWLPVKPEMTGLVRTDLHARFLARELITPPSSRTRRS